MSVTEIQDLVVLHCVVKHGSYAKAAEELALSRSRISRVISALEERLEVRLVQRTTRKLSLTEAGRAFCEQTRSILAELEEAQAEVREQGLTPRGRLRMSVPTVFGKVFVVPLLDKFSQRFPELHLELNLADRYVDLIEEGVDLAIRIGPVNDPQLSFLRLCTNRRYLVASPSYLAQHGEPQSVADLTGHDCILFAGFKQPSEWKLIGPEGPASAAVSGSIISNNMHVLGTCALQGLGIAPGATMVIAEHLLSGALVRVLPQYEFAATAVFAVYPSQRQLSTKVRPVVAFLDEHLHDPPPWDQPLLARLANG